jgi:hypothetical protein
MRGRLVVSLSGTLLLFAVAVAAQTLPHNYEGPPRGDISIASVISLVDSGWTTNTATSDCATGWGDDTWNLRLTTPRNLTVTVNDCCCTGDFYEVYVDGRLIGTTPNPGTWGCSVSGANSSGSFTVSLCPGNHEIKVRDAGFDGHSFDQISAENMCPAGFTVSGALAAAAPAPISATSEARIPFNPVTAANSPKADEIESQLREVAPYVYVDGNGLERLHVDEARRAGVSGQAIGLAMQLIAVENRVIAAAQRDEEADLSAADFAFIEPLFLQLAQADPCGTRQNPSPCPPRVDSGRFFSTRDEAVTFLQGLGYHQTAGYAGGRTGNDFTLVVASACGGSSFRSQAIVHQQGACWTYNTQGPEPNPEVLSYIWPRLGWVGYVRWWHLVFC